MGKSQRSQTCGAEATRATATLGARPSSWGLCLGKSTNLGLNGHALLTRLNGHKHTALPEELHLKQTWLFNKPALVPCSGDL